MDRSHVRTAHRGRTFVERRLAAILAADVVGYSKLMAEDEAGTLTTLSQLIKDIVEPLIDEHNGRIVKLMGDGVLAEFGSVVDAVECAVVWQKRLARDSALQFRIGINLGEITLQDGDIFGHGVNVAARLEGLADPGGIYISEDVYRQAKGRTDAAFEDLGNQNIKNIDEPIRAYRVNSSAQEPTRADDDGVSLSIPDKPSIAVLPFDNMSGDPEQEFFADGITEDLITALSKVRWFFVIARNSTFTYKGQAVDVTKVSQELGVKYVLEGSVRTAGSRVRITAQLIDATTGRHVWAERYDRQIEDIFDLQDEMTQTIVGAVEPEISATERQRAVAKQPDNLDAWESYQRGVWHMWTYAEEDNPAALEFLSRASELDPSFSPAHAYRSYVHYQSVVMNWSDDIDASLNDGMIAARKALALDEQDATAYFAVGRIHMMQGNHEDSIAALETAIKLNPSFAQAHHGLGMVLCLAGEFERATKANLMCERLSPRDPIIWASLVVQAFTYLLAEDYENALVWVQKALQHPRATGYWPHAVFAAVLAQLDRLDEAKDAAEQALKANPAITLSLLAKTYPTKNPDGLQPYIDGLRKAGLREK